MSLPRFWMLLVALFFMGVSEGSFAAQQSHGTVSATAKLLRGTWYSPEGSITFKDDGTINLRRIRYYYAVSNGGMIQLSGKHSSNAIPYQLAGGKLTLTLSGKSTVYTRTRP